MSLEVWGDDSDGTWDSEPVRLTNLLLRMKPPVSRGLVVNRPADGMTWHDRMFQASMWREYAMTWHGKSTRSGITQRWCEQIGRWTYAECLRRARVNLYLARRARRATLAGQV